MKLTENKDVRFPRKILLRRYFAPLLSSCAALLLSMPAAANTSVSDDQAKATQQIAAEEADQYARFLQNYVRWANIIEAEGQQLGMPLTSNQIELASDIGIKRPEKVASSS